MSHSIDTESVVRDVIVVGASVGGIKAVTELLSRLPADLPAVIGVVIHRGADSKASWSEVLGMKTSLRVVETGTLPMARGSLYLLRRGRQSASSRSRGGRGEPEKGPTMRSMMRGCCVLFLTVAGPAGFAGCATNPGASSAADVPAHESAAKVPTGIAFRAHLDRALSSAEVRVGEHFTATLDEPLRSQGGSELVPRCAQLMGHVIGVDRIAARLTLQFDGMYLDGRLRPIAVNIVGIEGTRVVGADASSTSPSSDGAGTSSPIAFVYPMAKATASELPVGGGPPSESTPVQIAPGAELQLMLSRPFAPPAREAKPESHEEHRNPRVDGL